MRLTRLEIIPIRCHQRGAGGEVQPTPPPSSDERGPARPLPPRKRVDGALVRLHTDEGWTGVGEAGVQTHYLGDTPAHITALLERWWPALRGQDPFRIAALHQTMKTPYGGYKVAEAAVDEALYDIMGKVLGQPVHRLSGRSFHTKIRLFGTVGFTGLKVPPASELGGGIDALIEHARAYQRAGHFGLEVKMGHHPPPGPDFEEHLQLLKAVLDMVPSDAPVVVDLNQRWDVTAVINVFGSEFRGVRNLAVEQPAHYLDFAGLARISRALDLPVIADESATSPEAVLLLARMEAAQGINLKVNRVGGIYPALRMIDIAETAGMQIHVDYTPLTKLGDTVNAHVAAQIMERRSHALDGYEWFEERPLASVGIAYDTSDGAWALLPDAPGLGVELTPELLEPLRSDLPVRVLE